LHAVALLADGQTAQAQASSNFIDYAIFGKSGINLQGATVTGGTVGSNGDVNVGPFATFSALAGGGALYANGPTVSGNVTFNDDVNLGGANVGGAINSGGNVTIGSFANTHPITAHSDINFGGNSAVGNMLAGDTFTLQAFASITGNVGASNNVVLNGGTIHGNVTYGNALSLNGGNFTGTATNAPVSVNPTPFTPVTLPNASVFTAGGPNLTTGGTAANPLAPGKYGDLNLAVFNDLYLVPGNYYFTSLELLHSPTIHLLGLTAQNQINIFVTGDVTVGSLGDVTVNGTPFGSADHTLASRVLLETLGQYQDGGSNQFFGTIFAPNGDLTLGGFDQIDGSLLSGDRINVAQGGVTLLFAPSSALPEPSSLLLYGLGLLGLLGLARLRRPAAAA
jgi:cytoskeletal protein CcmA (bactofilin family)